MKQEGKVFHHQHTEHKQLKFQPPSYLGTLQSKVLAKNVAYAVYTPIIYWLKIYLVLFLEQFVPLMEQLELVTNFSSKVFWCSKTISSSSDNQVFLIFINREIHDFQKVSDTPRTTFLPYCNNIPISLFINNTDPWRLVSTPKGKATYSIMQNKYIIKIWSRFHQNKNNPNRPS